MEIVKELAKTLITGDFTPLIALGGILILTILIIAKGTLLQFSLKILTKKKSSFAYIILPTLISIILTIILIGLGYLIFTNNNLDLLDLGIRYVFGTLTDYSSILFVILVFFGIIITSIIFQSFILKLVDFDLMFYIRVLFCKICKINYEVNDEFEKTSPTIFQSFVAGLLSFVIVFFVAIVLIYIGEIIGPIIIK